MSKMRILEGRPRSSSGPGPAGAKQGTDYDKRKSRDDLYIITMSSEKEQRRRQHQQQHLQQHQHVKSFHVPIRNKLSPRGARPTVTSRLEVPRGATTDPRFGDIDQGNIAIGMALGSPSHAPSATEWQPQLASVLTPSPATPESHETNGDMTPKSKSRKWGLFRSKSKSKKSKAAITGTSPPQFTVDPAYTSPAGLPTITTTTTATEKTTTTTMPAGHPGSGLTRGNSVTISSDRNKPRVTRSRTEPIMTDHIDPRSRPQQLARGNSLARKPVPARTNGDYATYTGEHRGPPVSRQTPGNSGPLLDVEIPDITMERYSIMFGNVLQKRQQQQKYQQQQMELEQQKKYQQQQLDVQQQQKYQQQQMELEQQKKYQQKQLDVQQQQHLEIQQQKRYQQQQMELLRQQKQQQREQETPHQQNQHQHQHLPHQQQKEQDLGHMTKKPEVKRREVNQNHNFEGSNERRDQKGQEKQHQKIPARPNPPGRSQSLPQSQPQPQPQPQKRPEPRPLESPRQHLKSPPRDISSSSLLSRRQATLSKLKTIEDEEEQMIPLPVDLAPPRPVGSPRAERRSSPTFNLFPATPKTSSVTQTPSPRMRSNTSPAGLPSPRHIAADRSQSRWGPGRTQTFPRPIHDNASGELLPSSTYSQRRPLQIPTKPQHRPNMSIKGSPPRSFSDSPTSMDQSPIHKIRSSQRLAGNGTGWDVISPFAGTGTPRIGTPKKGSISSIMSSERISVLKQDPAVDEAEAERALEEAVEASITRQISVSREQRQMLGSLRGHMRRTNGNEDSQPRRLGSVTVGKNERLVDTKKLTPTLVHPGSENEMSSIHMHRRSERVVVEGA